MREGLEDSLLAVLGILQLVDDAQAAGLGICAPVHTCQTLQEGESLLVEVGHVGIALLGLEHDGFQLVLGRGQRGCGGWCRLDSGLGSGCSGFGCGCGLCLRLCMLVIVRCLHRHDVCELMI